MMQLCICVCPPGQMDDVLDSVCALYHGGDDHGYAPVLVSGLHTDAVMVEDTFAVKASARYCLYSSVMLIFDASSGFLFISS